MRPSGSYALCTAVPLVLVMVTVFTAGAELHRKLADDRSRPRLDAATGFNLN